MKSIKLELFSFNELSEKAKEKIINSWRDNDEYFWGSENADSLNAFCDIFQIKINNYDYGYQNYINVSFNLESEVLDFCHFKAATWLSNNYLNKLRRPKTYYGKGYGKKRNSKIFYDYDCTLTGYYIDNSLIMPLLDFINKPDNRSVENVLNDCLNSWLSACKEDYEHWLSSESIIEDIEANDYMFLINGELATKYEAMAA
jgi:hypothetical protein